MNVPTVLLANVSDPLVIVVAGGIVAALLIFLLTYASRYTKVGPNEVLVISGRKRLILEPDGKKHSVGYRIVKGGGAFVWPVVEKAEILSLELMTLDVKTPAVYCVTGVSVFVDGVAQIKVKGDDVAIATASEQFLSKPTNEIMKIALQTIEGHLRAIVGTLTMEEIYRNREMFQQKVQDVAATDLANMGLEIISFTLREIKDNEGYLEALGKPRVAEVKRDAIIAQAQADRDSMIKSAQATQEGQMAKILADTKIAEANRDFEMKKAEYGASVNLKRAEADLAYDLQRYKTGQSVKNEEMQVQIVEKTKGIEIQEKEITRRQKELEATVSRPADAERYRIQALAEAERFKLEQEAEGHAEAARVMGVGEADAAKAKGLADAAVIAAKGASEAEAMAKKADSWKAYTEAAMAQMIIDRLPELARAIAEPLSRTDKIVIVSNGGNPQDGAGASKVTRDVTNILAQLPPTIEALTGLKFEDLLRRIPGAHDAAKSDSKSPVSDRS
ncbi:MAG: flotillin family protein [Planctomycetes bacterium]|nr:flotillin family protein [Planctomycetota bacterium]MBI3848239.1 flotillin family protein [Planctomycetota bacterium]